MPSLLSGRYSAVKVRKILYVTDWDAFGEFKRDLEAYIHHWNNVRRQVGLKGLTPVEFRERALREAA